MEKGNGNRVEIATEFIMQFINKSEPRRAYIQLAEMINKMEFSDIEEYEAKKRILEKCFDIFSRPDVRKNIKENKMTARQVFEQYVEDILGDNKRRYDMADMYDETIIASQQVGEVGERKRIIFKDIDNENEPCKNEFYDKNGRKLSIEVIGDLAYENALKTRNYLKKYRIIKQLPNGTFKAYEVFSIINLSKMDDEEYKDAVLEELLSDNNIELSHVNGYIGTIMPGKEKIGTEKVEKLAYHYQTNEKYEIEYNAEDLSAVVSYGLGLSEIHPKIKRKEDLER